MRFASRYRTYIDEKVIMCVHAAFERKKKKTNSIISISRIVAVSLIFIELYIIVRNYIRKTAKLSYTEDDINNVIEKIRTKEWTYEEAASLTNIPIGTIASRMFSKIKLTSRSSYKFENNRRKVFS